MGRDLNTENEHYTLVEYLESIGFNLGMGGLYTKEFTEYYFQVNSKSNNIMFCRKRRCSLINIPSINMSFIIDNLIPFIETVKDAIATNIKDEFDSYSKRSNCVCQEWTPIKVPTNRNLFYFRSYNDPIEIKLGDKLCQVFQTKI